MFSPTLINTPTSFDLQKKLVDLIFESIGTTIPIPQSGTVNIAFIEDDAIRELNAEYRGIDATTDVLSFHYFEDYSSVPPEEIAGEIVLSESRIMKQAGEYKNTPEAEFAKLLIHSTLHLLGYDHETDEEYQAMHPQEQKIEKILLEKIGMTIY